MESRIGFKSNVKRAGTRPSPTNKKLVGGFAMHGCSIIQVRDECINHPQARRADKQETYSFAMPQERDRELDICQNAPKFAPFPMYFRRI